MQFQRPLRTVTASVDGDVLMVLARADAEFTPPQVHRILGERSVEGVRNALDRLVEQGIVRHRTVGRAGVYRLNRDHLGASAIIELATMFQELVDRLTERLQSWDRPAEFAAIFGSAATGTMRSGSDLDIFVVRPDDVGVDDEVWDQQISSLERDVTSWTGNDTRVVQSSPDDCRRGMAQGATLFIDVAREGIWLVGPVHYLTEMRVRGSDAKGPSSEVV